MDYSFIPYSSYEHIYGYSVSCDACNNPLSSIKKGGHSEFPIKHCRYCRQLFTPIKMIVGSKKLELSQEEYGQQYVGFQNPPTYRTELHYSTLCDKCAIPSMSYRPSSKDADEYGICISCKKPFKAFPIIASVKINN